MSDENFPRRKPYSEYKFYPDDHYDWNYGSEDGFVDSVGLLKFKKMFRGMQGCYLQMKQSLKVEHAIEHNKRDAELQKMSREEFMKQDLCHTQKYRTVCKASRVGDRNKLILKLENFASWDDTVLLNMNSKFHISNIPEDQPPYHREMQIVPMFYLAGLKNPLKLTHIELFILGTQFCWRPIFYSEV